MTARGPHAVGEHSRSTYEGGNRVLDALPVHERTNLVKHIRMQAFASGDIVQEPGGDVSYIDFPIDAVISVVTVLLDGNTCEVGTIGNEGAAGIDVAFGSTLLRTTVCQVAGQIARLPRRAFLATVDSSRTFSRLIGRISQAQRFFVEQQCACNALHTVDKRCARWFMTIYQRVNRQHFSITHEFLSVMLGVRRGTVSRAAMDLQRAGIITYRRGNVEVLSVAKLAAACCECYDATRNVFDSSFTANDELSEHIAT
jgi:hypothetical protein